MKKILILNGSFCEQPIIEKAKEMGLYVVTTGNAPELIGHKYADEYIPCDYSDKEAVLQLVRDNGIEGIVSCANDFGVITAAYVAEQMGWKGHDTYENAMLIHHKASFKEYCEKHNIPSPKTISFFDKEKAYDYVEGCEYPIIVKANDLTGGKGIHKAFNANEAEKAIDIAFEKSRDKHIVIEPYIEGKQQSIDTYIIDGKVVSVNSCDCYSYVNPYLIQAETLPAEGIENYQDQLVSIIENMAADLNLEDGIFCLQYIVKDNQPYIIEGMRRIFGNQFTCLLEKITGFPWNEAYIRTALDMGYDGMKIGEPSDKGYGHYGIMAEQNGTLLDYSVNEELSTHVYKEIEMLKVGDEIEDYLNQRVKYLFYEFDVVREMRELIRNKDSLAKMIVKTGENSNRN
ncbi:ATP-grasp domain-containing protein [Pseudobutyrivibrio sp.]|uniref:ATP-grasp domain-containing protein n=1 Tax=Pseudobutyrivibrio sp. TaxID=2014367 RepID=UPI0025ECEDA1|nr:ATP-grasp domain-containing protein [Pseudobutyrivibrio sp.]MBR5648302.1 ATP-grasp domain-containing protein [Pseudobutyrivibrio sp.]